MGADLRAFFDDDDRLVWRDLFEPDSGGEPRRPCADDDRVELHRFTGWQRIHGLYLNSGLREPIVHKSGALATAQLVSDIDGRTDHPRRWLEGS